MNQPENKTSISLAVSLLSTRRDAVIYYICSLKCDMETSVGALRCIFKGRQQREQEGFPNKISGQTMPKEPMLKPTAQ